MLDRRELLTGAAALSLAGCATTGARTTPEQADAALDAMLNRWFYEDLQDAPETATNLGLDTGERAALRAQLADRSPAKAAEDRVEAQARLQELRRTNRAALSEAGKLNYDIAEFRTDVAAGFARDFPYHAAGMGRPGPYVVNQIAGAYFATPDFMDSQHPVNTAADADAYLARMTAFAQTLDHDTARLTENSGRGVVPPVFILNKTLGQVRGLRDTPASEAPMVRSLARRASEKGLGDYGARATSLFEGPIRASLTRQIETLERLRGSAKRNAGVWELPRGDAYYAQTLRANTTTTMTPDEVHRTGLEQVADLHRQIDAILRAQGYTQGTVGERLNVLNREPRHVWPNTDQGRADLLASLNAQVADITPRLPRMFRTLPRAQVEIRRVPVAIEQGAPGGYYQGAPLDGSRPGAYYINLKDTAEWPKWGLPSLTYHEAVPGHHFQISISREAGTLPIYRRAGGFSAYNEGWALYAERVADELGVYENDPLGRIGYLQSYLFRAVRLVVDTGLHAKRWSREQAIRYMVENAAEPEGSAVREIERYIVMPGQACSYKIGQTVIARLRTEAEARPGFDIKDFHDTVLLSGSMPLTVLERVVDQRFGLA